MVCKSTEFTDFPKERAIHHAKCKKLSALWLEVGAFDVEVNFLPITEILKPPAIAKDPMLSLAIGAGSVRSPMGPIPHFRH